MKFSDSYLGKLRKVIGSRLVLIPGARIVVHDRLERVLLGLRSDFRRWGLPCGHREIRDSRQQLASREVSEETSLTIGRPKVFGIASDPEHETIRFPNGDRTQTVSILFHARKPRGEPKFDPHETLELGWFGLDDLPADLMPNSRRTIRAFGRYRRTGKLQMI